MSIKSGCLNLLEPCGPVQACNATAYLYLLSLFEANATHSLKYSNSAIHALALRNVPQIGITISKAYKLQFFLNIHWPLNFDGNYMLHYELILT
jgi:hypothetical protein